MFPNNSHERSRRILEWIQLLLQVADDITLAGLNHDNIAQRIRTAAYELAGEQLFDAWKAEGRAWEIKKEPVFAECPRCNGAMENSVCTFCGLGKQD